MFKPGCINQPANSTMILRCVSSCEKLPQGSIAKLSNAIHIILSSSTDDQSLIIHGVIDNLSINPRSKRADR